MAKTVQIDVPQEGLGDDLAGALAAHGLEVELVGEALEVRFADEHERLLAAAITAIEDYLSERDLPFVVQRDGDGAVVRPPAE